MSGSVLDTMATSFFQRALVEAVLVGALAGFVGVHVLLHRLPFFVVATSHATFPGVVVAGALGVSLALGGFAAGLVLVVAIVALGQRARVVGDTTVTGVLLAGAFALGVVMASARTNGSRDLAAYLVGSVLTVTTGDIAATVLAGVAVVAVLGALHKELVFVAFDATGALAAGYHTRRLDAAVMVAVLATMAVAVPAVGTLLVLALAVVPALTARALTDRVGPALVTSAAAGACAALAGMVVTATWPVPAGAAIALASVGLYALVVLGLAVRRSSFVTRRRPLAGPPVGSAP